MTLRQEDLYQRFNCSPGTSGAVREPRSRRKRRETCDSTSAAFEKVMRSESPPRNSDEAVAAVKEEMCGSLLGSIAWMFIEALVYQIVKWLWARYQNESASSGRDSG